MRILDWLPGLVARVPASIHVKLLGAFLVIAALLIAVGTAGLQALADVNRRAEDLVKLQRKIAAYRQLQHDTTSQLYSVSSALLMPNARSLKATLRQLNQFGYDLDRLQFVARDEVELLGQVREEYERFMGVVAKVVKLIRDGHDAGARELELAQAGPLADRLERLTNQLVNKAEADMVASIDTSAAAYGTAQRIVVVFALGSIGLALLLGFAISWSIITPVQTMEARLREITRGDFSGTVAVPNRDELGALAADLNHMNDKIQEQTAELATWNRTLEARVGEQLAQLDRLGRLKRFLPAQLAEVIVSAGNEKLLESHRREITVVFCDLRGFTTFAETADPEEVMDVLREYHAVLGQLIFKFEGTLEHFAGDGVMVFFNDPVPCPDPAARAVRMAMAMREAVTGLSAKWQRRGHQLAFGIGIAQGYATLGTIGFEGRFDYGAIGPVTNLASRLCGEAKGGEILVSQRAFTAVEEFVEAEPAREFTLKGFHRPIVACNVLRLRG